MLSDHLQTLSHKKKEKQGPMKKMNLVEMYFNDYMLAYRCCYISISNRNSKQPKNSLKNSGRILIIDFYYSRSKSYIDMSSNTCISISCNFVWYICVTER